MALINPLVTGFLQKHPADCARILEQFPVNAACQLILSIKPELAAGMMECLVTSYGSEYIRTLDTQKAVSLIKEMKIPHAARLLRAMPLQNSKNILDASPALLKNAIHSALRYPEQTVGRIMDANPFSLPESISISDAVTRVRNLRDRTLHEIFVVDDDYKLKGVIHVAHLLSAARASSIQTIITRDIPHLTTRTSLDSAAVHLGWQTFSTLPVVGKDYILSGILKSSTLMHVLSKSSRRSDSPCALDDMFSMTKMYWIVMAELINAAAGDIKEIRGKKE
jgi:magnesium transporter